MSGESDAVAAARREFEAIGSEHDAELSALGESTQRQREESEKAAAEQQRQFEALADRVRQIAADRDAPKQDETFDFSPEEDDDLTSGVDPELDEEARQFATMIPRPHDERTEGGEPAATPEPEPRPSPAAAVPPPAPRPVGRRQAARDLDEDDEEDMSNQTWMRY